VGRRSGTATTCSPRCCSCSPVCSIRTRDPLEVSGNRPVSCAEPLARVASSRGCEPATQS
jgi:hypothetical protein